MIDRDLERAARLIEDHERGSLTDTAVYGTLALVRAEATNEERQKCRERLERLAAQYSAQGRADIAYAFAQAARTTGPAVLGAPTLADVADA